MNAPLLTAPGCWCKGKCPNIAHALELERQRRPRLYELELRRILIDAPSCPEAHRGLARVLISSNRAAAASEHLQKARDVIGLTPELALQITVALRSEAKIPAAIAAGTRAVELAPDNLQAYIVLAGAFVADGQIDAAAAIVADAEKRFATAGDGVQLRRVVAMIAAERKDFEAAIDHLAGDDLPPIELFDRGRYHERLGHYELAWRDWMRAKEIQRTRENCVYNAAAIERNVADLYEMSRPPRLAYLRGCSVPPLRPWPIFITGFPRSGTTMVEAAMSSHPAIVAGDELMFLPEIIERCPAWLNVRVRYPRALMATAWPENRTVPYRLRDTYLAKSLQKIGIEQRADYTLVIPSPLEQAAGRVPPLYFTDKMPSNEMHWPLIALLFPETPIVHVRRHPLDILVSNMSHFLVHGNFNACSLEWCARHYALTDGLTDHYRRKLPWLRLHQVRYESFVADHRPAIDAMLPGDLEPDDRCYDFHLNPWHSRTISHRQIKEPVHDRSVGRYKPFLDFLRPIVPLIRETLEREGYDL